ncbi:ATP-binding protein [Nguyenibacter vanlangensis]|uniref:histidine kinase n=1 Tax=Nguyenibacter vanlangensis TaxID=1216886 RepID=A0ABZ3D393_9PROT
MALILGSSGVATLVLAAGIFVSFHVKDSGVPLGPWPDALAISSAIRAIEATPQAARGAVAGSLATPGLGIVSGASVPCPVLSDALATRALRRALYTVIAHDRRVPLVTNCAADGWRHGASHVVFEDQRVTFIVRNYAHVSRTGIVLATLPLALWLGTITLGIGVLVSWSAWSVGRPLGRLAEAAERFGARDDSDPLEESGPSEIRLAIRAFNLMQSRLTRSAEERRRLLMAVGHDLRTPLTRMAMRIELADDESGRAGMTRDIDLMARMLDNAMALFKGYDENEAWQDIDLGTMAADVCRSFAEVGRDVRYQGASGPLCSCQPLGITRVIGNLIDNGCRHGTAVTVDVRGGGDWARLEVADDGPGIPACRRDAALLPFSRLHAHADSDAGHDAHFGLGLSIVADIVRRHGGTLDLRDAQPSGLRVIIHLPIKGPSATSWR